ncbi:putative phage repressor [Desulfobulbus propionicus DSM 2032]|uniref:Phage repressor n=1 Tax=Desulfobulbus propionicus (strain ATCC 33891 / DSM 2032 / VKM B-1956 / 1pr3) TaxID=577650 RepID=A0A7U3YNF5_DESPD|nr:XRE family transcriptional regulator [Desulfobulbus propionicus]ADW18604.1 putative phage repressor [Desulfobulbus propionicus DSM 2032]
MSLGNRIKSVRGTLSQKEFSDVCKVGISTLRRYESGVNPPDSDFLCAIVDNYNINPMWLLSGEGPMYRERNTDPHGASTNSTSAKIPQRPVYMDDSGQVVIPQWQNPDPEMFDYIPMAETQLSAGGGAFVISEEIEGYYAFRKSWLSRVASSTKNLVLMRVLGDSMSPTIQEDDTVMIDIGKRSIKEGMIYAIRFDSTVMIKRLAFRPGGRIMIISDNRHEYEPYEADMRELHIIGQIIFFCRTFATE